MSPHHIRWPTTGPRVRGGATVRSRVSVGVAVDPSLHLTPTYQSSTACARARVPEVEESECTAEKYQSSVAHAHICAPEVE